MRLHRRWVRVAVPQGLTPQEVQRELERALGAPLPHCSMDRRHFVIQCESQEQQDQLLGYDRGHIDGRPLRVQRAEYSMSGEELLNFVRDQLLQEDELRLLKQSYGCEKEEGVPTTPLREKNGGGIFAVVQGNPPQGTVGASDAISEPSWVGWEGVPGQKSGVTPQEEPGR